MSDWVTDTKSWFRLKKYARAMRKEPTLAEKLLWRKLRNNQLAGLKFRRQFAIGAYIVDFYCSQYNLVIELDGMSHDKTLNYDKERQNYLEAQGYIVLRYMNEDVLRHMVVVQEDIINKINEIK